MVYSPSGSASNSKYPFSSVVVVWLKLLLVLLMFIEVPVAGEIRDAALPSAPPAACKPAFTFSPKVAPCVCFATVRLVLILAGASLVFSSVILLLPAVCKPAFTFSPKVAPCVCFATVRLVLILAGASLVFSSVILLLPAVLNLHLLFLQK